VSDPKQRYPILIEFYQQYLVDQSTASFVRAVASRYLPPTLSRLAVAGDRVSRRAAVLALGFLAGYEANGVLGQCLRDRDRGVRTLAENSIQSVWKRAGNEAQREHLVRVIRLNNAKQHEEAIHLAGELAERAPWFAEAWNQRAVAHFHRRRYKESIRDCQQALEINPYHFGAATGIGQCYLQLGNRHAALEAFRRALKINPSLEGVRAHVVHLERALQDEMD